MPEFSRSGILASVGANVLQLSAGTFTQQELEALTGLDVQYIRKIEGGRVNITIDTLRRLANALGVSPGVLLRKAKFSRRSRGAPEALAAPRP